MIWALSDRRSSQVERRTVSLLLAIKDRPFHWAAVSLVA
jgi:hypothetical protein